VCNISIIQGIELCIPHDNIQIIKLLLNKTPIKNDTEEPLLNQDKYTIKLPFKSTFEIYIICAEEKHIGF